MSRIFLEGNLPKAAYAMEWRVCLRFPNFEVSECGDVKVVKATKFRKIGQRVNAIIAGGGYPAYTLADGDGEFIAVPAYRLVAEAFLGPKPSPEYEVAHKNGSRLSAYWRDLRWSTRADNNGDKLVHGTSGKGRKNGRSKLTESQVPEIRAAYAAIKQKPRRSARKELIALADKYGITETALDYVGKGYTWAHVPME